MIVQMYNYFLNHQIFFTTKGHEVQHKAYNVWDKHSRSSWCFFVTPFVPLRGENVVTTTGIPYLFLSL